MESDKVSYIMLIKPLNYILNIAEEHSYLWENPDFFNGRKSLDFFEDFSEKDDLYYRFYIQYFNGIFSFGEKKSGKRQLSAIQLAKMIEKLEIKVSPDDLLGSFFRSIKGPLGGYLSKRKIEEMKKNAEREYWI